MSLEDIDHLYTKKMNELYEERDRLVALISSLYPSYLSKDNECEEGFQNVVYIETPEGQLSWHIQDKELLLFKHLTYKENKWDGHTTEEKYTRIKKLVDKNTATMVIDDWMELNPVPVSLTQLWNKRMSEMFKE